MSSSAPWLRVASGLRLVASAATSQASERVGTVANAASRHGLDLASNFRSVAAVFSGADATRQQVPSPRSGVEDQYNQPMSNDADMDRFDTAMRDLNGDPQQRQIRHGYKDTGSDWKRTTIESRSMPSRGRVIDAMEQQRRQEQEQEQEKEADDSISNQFTESKKRDLSNMESAIPKDELDAAKDELQKALNEKSIVDPPQTQLDQERPSSSSTDIKHLPHELIQTDESTPNNENSIRLLHGTKVPSTRLGRAFGFASLGLGLAAGTAAELTSRLFQNSSTTTTSVSPVASDANADRLAATLCRMRGAALKLGQMLSIQDESLLPPALSKALHQVRQGADAMPRQQLLKQLESQLGNHWRDRLGSFDEMPMAAASIGQVHKATLPPEAPGGSSKRVVMKVQYPGVADSIESDLKNLSTLVKLTGLAPPGLFVDEVIRVGRDELKVECDYEREMQNQLRFKRLVESDDELVRQKFIVPDVVKELTSRQVLTTEYAPGGTIDRVANLSFEERNRIARGILRLTMLELFQWRFMQTDPNWGNFLYDMGSGTTYLIDFGAAREYDKQFVDGYLRIVWAAANRDEDALMSQSLEMGFLTGDENDVMRKAHKLSGFTVGEPFRTNEAFDFRGSNISSRISEHSSAFLQHRLTPPPEEVYTLHRKLAGAYMLCIKLGAVIPCRDLLEDIMEHHVFEDKEKSNEDDAVASLQN